MTEEVLFAAFTIKAVPNKIAIIASIINMYLVILSFIRLTTEKRNNPKIFNIAPEKININIIVNFSII